MKTPLLLLLFFSHSLFAAPLEELDKFIEGARIQYKAPGLAIAIVKEDKVIFAKGYGLCNYNQIDKVNPHTIFQLGSVSKTFASAGLGVQVDRKKLNWDDEIVQHLPQFALQSTYATRYATSRDLLAHRTALPAFRGDLLGKLGLTSSEVLYRCRFIQPASSFRNKAFYSNVGFFIAGELLAKLVNSSWQDTIQTNLLNPLKMTRSGFAANLDNSNVAYPHAIVNGNVTVIPRDKSVQFVAAGGVTSTAMDMGNWMIMHLNEGMFEGNQILSSKTIKEMHLPSMVSEISFSEMPPIDENSSLSYGLGWTCYNYKGKSIVEKGGALDGVRAVVTLVPELKLGIVVLANLNLTVLPELIRAKFLESYIGKYERDLDKEYQALEQKLSEIVSAPQKPENPLPLKRPLSDCTGRFANDLYGELVITQQEDHLIATAGPAHLTATLMHWSNDTFILKWPTINSGYELVTFTFGPNGKAVDMQTETLGTFHSQEK